MLYPSSRSSPSLPDGQAFSFKFQLAASQRKDGTKPVDGVLGGTALAGLTGPAGTASRESSGANGLTRMDWASCQAPGWKHRDCCSSPGTSEPATFDGSTRSWAIADVKPNEFCHSMRTLARTPRCLIYLDHVLPFSRVYETR